MRLLLQRPEGDTSGHPAGDHHISRPEQIHRTIARRTIDRARIQRVRLEPAAAERAPASSQSPDRFQGPVQLQAERQSDSHNDLPRETEALLDQPCDASNRVREATHSSSGCQKAALSVQRPQSHLRKVGKLHIAI